MIRLPQACMQSVLIYTKKKHERMKRHCQCMFIDITLLGERNELFHNTSMKRSGPELFPIKNTLLKDIGGVSSLCH